jgi:hypothetical protein
LRFNRFEDNHGKTCNHLQHEDFDEEQSVRKLFGPSARTSRQTSREEVAALRSGARDKPARQGRQSDAIAPHIRAEDLVGTERAWIGRKEGCYL